MDIKGEKIYFKSDHKQMDQQKDKQEDVKNGLQNHKMWGGKVRKSRLFFFRMCLRLYDHHAKSSNYRKGLMYWKNSGNTNQNKTLHSQKLKRKGQKRKIKRNHPTKQKK